jgi:hypothetical protein
MVLAVAAVAVVVDTAAVVVVAAAAEMAAVAVTVAVVETAADVALTAITNPTGSNRFGKAQQRKSGGSHLRFFVLLFRKTMRACLR